MTREILFRGRISKNEWVYGLPIEGEPLMGRGKETCIVTKPGLSYYDGVLMTYDECVEVDPDTIGQLTGLTDRNGVKIFEGDIVAVKVYNSPIFENYKVVWFVGDGGFHLFRPKREKMDVGWDAKRGEIGYGTDLNDLVIRQRMVEVIGNIYDNPELLEVSGNE